MVCACVACLSERYRAMVQDIESLIKEGMPKKDAKVVIDCFMTADAYGVSSHGMAILSSHLDRIKRGGYNLTPKFKIIRETPSFAVIDGENAMGPVAANYCMEYAVKRCREVGVFTVFSRNNNTFGPAFYYPLKAAEQGIIGFICANSPAQMAPIGGLEKMLGTNPFAAVIPVPGKDPIIIDMATSVVAKSKFKEYKTAGKLLPQGWALDKEGRPTTDPDDAMQGLVLPMAGFKGYAISMLIDIISGVLSGAAFLNHVGRFYSEDNASMNVGYYMVAMDPKQVLGEEWDRMIVCYTDEIRNSEPISGRKIALPGDDRLQYKKQT